MYRIFEIVPLRLRRESGVSDSNSMIDIYDHY